MLRKGHIATRLCQQLTERIAPQGDIALEIVIRQAMLSIAEDRPRDAVAQARSAIAHAKRAEMPWEQAQANRVLALAYIKLSRKQQARKALIAARDLFAAMGEKLELHVVESWLSVLNNRPRRSHQSQWRAQKNPLSQKHAQPQDNSNRAKSSIAISQVDIISQYANQDGGSEALRFWLNHPLLGPIHWLARKSKKTTPPRTAAMSNPSETRDNDTAIQNNSLPIQSRERKQVPQMAYDSIWAKLGLLTRSENVMAILKRIPAYANEQIPVLILGETGTGKDLIVRGLHQLSNFPGQLVPVNCADASTEIFAAELFGANKGAYTGAENDRTGLIEEARNGTLFLDEIGDLSSKAQGYLLRFLDSGEIRPRGATKSYHIQTRIVAATCRNLVDSCAAGKFRLDLHARLAGVVIEVPPLRGRIEDIPLLINSLWQRVGGNLNECHSIFTEEVIGYLKQQIWPQNIRQLKHTINNIRLACKVAPADEVISDILGGNYYQSQSNPILYNHSQQQSNSGYSLEATSTKRSTPKPITEWDPKTLKEILLSVNGNISRAAEIMGVSRSHAYRIFRLLRDQNVEKIQRQQRQGDYLNRPNQ